MAAYMLFIREGAVRDADAMARYSALNQANTAAFIENHKLRPLSVYGAIEAFEGDAPDGIVLLEFPDANAARAWYNSDEYQAAIPHRMAGADYRAILLEGL